MVISGNRFAGAFDQDTGKTAVFMCNGFSLLLSEFLLAALCTKMMDSFWR